MQSFEGVGDPSVPAADRLRCVHEESDHVDVFERFERRHVELFAEHIVGLVDAGSVHNDHLEIRAREDCAETMARGLRRVRCNSDLFAHDSVEQRRLAGVRASNQRDETAPEALLQRHGRSSLPVGRPKRCSDHLVQRKAGVLVLVLFFVKPVRLFELALFVFAFAFLNVCPIHIGQGKLFVSGFDSPSLRQGRIVAFERFGHLLVPSVGHKAVSRPSVSCGIGERQHAFAFRHCSNGSPPQKKMQTTTQEETQPPVDTRRRQRPRS